MQTFLPFESFEKTAACLDYKRLGKQRVECKQIMQALLTKQGAWVNHPAVLMWEGNETALYIYYCYIVSEWIERGYRHNMEILPVCPADIAYVAERDIGKRLQGKIPAPKWLGGYIHHTHKAKLLEKDFNFYYPKFGRIDQIPYHWPYKTKAELYNSARVVSRWVDYDVTFYG